MSVLSALLAIALAPAAARPAGWTQWGGPTRDFAAPAATLSASWPEDGPRRLWSRPLGDGHSAILFDEGRLYTMHRPRDGEDEPVRPTPDAPALEAVICLDAGSGETLWEYRYDTRSVRRPEYGDGPRSTPLIVGRRLFAVSRSGRLLALDKRDGSLLWSRELWSEPLAGNILAYGYSSSPLAHEGAVILPVGGPEASVVAFDQESGAVRWQLAGFTNSLASPRIVEIAGREQLVTFMREELIGIDPGTGELLWSWPHANQWGHNATMPSVAGDTIFFSSPQAGARGLELATREGAIDVRQAWSSRRVQFYHGATAQIGDWIYGSTGTGSPAFMTAVNIRTGEIAWRERGFAKANCIRADGRLLILDENGVLYLADASPEALTVVSQTRILERLAWTVPTLVGTRLYARDRHRITAVDLG